MTTVKTVWTCCYGRARKLPSRSIQVSISRGTPDWWQPPQGRVFMPDGAPSAELLGEIKRNPGMDWKAAYAAEITPKLDELYSQTPDGAVLFCWESDWCECHRKVLFDLLAETYGVIGGEVPGGGPGAPKKKKPLPPQLMLL